MAESVSIIADSLLMSAAGLLMNYLGMKGIFKHRHPGYLWWTYFLIRAFTDGIYNAYFLSHESGGFVYFTYILFIVGTAVLTYAVQYYTWRADILKVGVAALLADMVAAVCIVIGTMTLNVICGRDPGASYQTALRPDSVPTVLLCLLAFFVIRIPESKGTVHSDSSKMSQNEPFPLTHPDKNCKKSYINCKPGCPPLCDN